ncbi:MAG: lysophospholipid acyltransferase family protein [Thermodesulfobacteriota bacterium]
MGDFKSGHRAAGVDTVLYYMIRGAFFLLGLVSRKTAGKAADWMGRLWFAFDRRHRHVAVANLTIAFGSEMAPAEIHAMARRVFCNLSRIVFEIGLAMHLDDKAIQNYFEFTGLHHLQAARRKGRGVLVLTAHIGNWELLICAAGMIGLPLSAIYRPLDFKPLDRFFVELRSRYGANLYPKARAMRKVMRSLAHKKMVGVLLDQSAGAGAGVRVDFFGKPAVTNKGLALLARATGAPVVPMILVRRGDKYTVVVEPEIPLIRTDNKTRDAAVNTRLYNQVLESLIRRYPEQWFWVHNRWKKRPGQMMPQGQSHKEKEK